MNHISNRTAPSINDCESKRVPTTAVQKRAMRKKGLRGWLGNWRAERLRHERTYLSNPTESSTHDEKQGHNRRRRTQISARYVVTLVQPSSLSKPLAHTDKNAEGMKWEWANNGMDWYRWRLQVFQDSKQQRWESPSRWFYVGNCLYMSSCRAQRTIAAKEKKLLGRCVGAMLLLPNQSHLLIINSKDWRRWLSSTLSRLGQHLLVSQIRQVQPMRGNQKKDRHLSSRSKDRSGFWWGHLWT